MRRRDRPDRDKRREERREWLRLKWKEKPRKLLDLVSGSTGLLKWIAILVGLFYGLQYFGGVDLLKILTGGGK